MTDRTTAREVARVSIERGDPTGWFEELYRIAQVNPEILPWADKKVNPHLVSWAEKNHLQGNGHRALVVGCGYGDDAEWLANRGFKVLAFDISETAISVALRRFQTSLVDYKITDALNLPDEWKGAFDFVFEAYTLQVLSGEVRIRAAKMIASTVKDTLLIICRGREENDDEGKMPWPLTKRELFQIIQDQTDLKVVSFDDFFDEEVPPVRRFRVEYHRS